MTTKRGGANPATVARYLFGLTLLLFLLSSFFPHLRVSGFSVWAHFPVYVPVLLATIGILIAVAEFYLSNQQRLREIEHTRDSTGRYFLLSLVVICLFAALTYFLRGRTHFLGDGYLNISELAKPQPLVKAREMGAGLVLVWLKGLLGGDAEKSASLAYHIVSIGSGVCFATVAALGSGLLFSRTRERVIMLIGLLSGGCTLMFFGYVENYALFAVCILSFTLLGLLVAEKRINKWFILVPLALACFFHIMGTLLIPAAVYLILADTRIASRLARASKSKKLALAGIPVITGLLVFGYLYKTDYYFRFAFVPVLPDRFSIKGYSLLSIAHVADVINLLFLLVPGLLLIFALFRMQPMKKLFESRSARFLLIATLTTLFAACVLDPKLGMPRDWDLLSIPGIPITALVLWLTLTRSTRARTHITIAVLFVTLGILSLLPRAIAQAVPEVGVATFTNYLELDPARARTGLHNLGKYYISHGDTASAVTSMELRQTLFPQEKYARLAEQAASAGQIGLAKSYTLMALSVNSTLADSWLALAYCYVEEGRYDSALEATRIADGLNPYNGLIRNEMAVAYSHLGHADKAVEIWSDLTASDTSNYGPPINLARLYQSRGNQAEYAKYLAIAAERDNAPPDLSLELAKYLLGTGDIQEAATACRQFLIKGGDSAQVATLSESNPKLAAMLGRR